MQQLFRRLGWKGWAAIAVVLAALGAIAGPYVYFNFIREEAAPPLTSSASSEPTEDTGTADAPVEGKWVVAADSVAGYRIEETLFGQDNTAIGRTEQIKGDIEITGSSVTKGEFEVDMTTVESDEQRRDRQFHGRIMQTARFPTAAFKLTEPIAIAEMPAPGVDGTAKATGELTLKGETKNVTFDVKGKRAGNTLQIKGEIPIVFEEWGIENPSFGPAQTEDNGLLEFALNFTHA